MIELERSRNLNLINEFEVKQLQIIKDFIKDSPNALTRDNKTAHITVSAWVLNPTLNKVLMAHHNIYNSWAWLGGHADGNHDLGQVAISEAMEETGIKDICSKSDILLVSMAGSKISFIVSPYSLEIFNRISKSGSVVPVSHFEIACLDISNFFANSSCV